MCDSVVIVGEAGSVWLAKNSDREPSESQAVEHIPAAEHPDGARLRCTHVEIPQVRRTHAITIARPTWMWGCEMGINQHALAVANEAVFTRLPIASSGLTSMDMQRLALERCRTADDAVEQIVELLDRFPQGGRMSHTGSLRYHGSFLLADPSGAWVLETAGSLWAAQRVLGRRSISNALTIEDDFDRIHPEAFAYARRRGYCRSSRDFGFARCFSRGFYTVVGGAQARAARTHASTEVATLGVRELAATLRDHADDQPASGLRMQMPCAHASWLPTRRAGQTTASMIARLDARGSQLWMTGTSSPCLSVFKPAPIDLGRPWAERPPERADADSLWWRHERLHRAVLGDWVTRRSIAAEQRAALEQQSFAATAEQVEQHLDLWDQHRRALPSWTERALAEGSARVSSFNRYWRRQSRRDGLCG
ncbi:MAG TPA: carcinine hydrolase/isopenicillin-N N-acyltransferase family protein [Enhygromyxa sp.]|nr:carcinine hydrolase/isopenicillin-N N-acyltransferase family protein [Enhygromyxa sp.]